MSEGEVLDTLGVVKFSEPKALHEGQDEDDSVTVAVTCLEKVYPCLLADPFVVSGWVKTKVGCCGIGEGKQKWPGDNCWCFCRSEEACAPC